MSASSCSSGAGRSPQGERGLKPLFPPREKGPPASLPARGAWVETWCRRSRAPPSWESLPARGAWVETHPPSTTHPRSMSLPARGAWVETWPARRRRTGAASRSPQGERGLKHGAPPTTPPRSTSLPARGAWVETSQRPIQKFLNSSPLPARGAWVETIVSVNQVNIGPVAPRKGSVG